MYTRRTSQTGQSPKNNLFRKMGKKPLPEPTHIGHFLTILILSACKKILHIDTAVKIGVYLCGTLVGSVLSDVFLFPKSYFSDKRNLLNKVFVGFGFGWTFLLLSLFIFLTSFVYSCGNWKVVIRKHLFRLGLATFWWMAMIKFFNHIETLVGVCSLQSMKDKQDCLQAGRTWLGFDVSGHAFLLIHNLLTISEEVKCFKYWNNLETLLKDEDLAAKRNLTEREISQSRASYKALTPYIKVLIVLLTIWTIVCEFMLIITVIYRFHTLTQKVAAAFIAVFCWFVSYRLILDADADFLPSQPGQSKLNFMK